MLKKMAADIARSRAEKVMVVRIEGHIGGGGMGRPGPTAESLEPVLKRAFEADRLKAVVLMINSPGGTPAQSEYIAERIRQYGAEKAVPVLAFCEEFASSGAYWVACAADEIFAARTSLVGSIGVVSAGFGLSDIIDRLGVERRLYATDQNKTRLDPFVPVDEADVEWMRALQRDLHDTFIAWVRQRREGRLDETADLFNGDVWTGVKAARVGLVDGIGVMRSVVAERYPDAEIEVVSQPRPFISRFMGARLDIAQTAHQVVTGAVSALGDQAVFRTR